MPPERPLELRRPPRAAAAAAAAAAGAGAGRLGAQDRGGASSGRWQRAALAGVCADSAGAKGCPAALVHRDAFLFCHSQGARLCTAAELRGGVAAGSGCGLDGARVWSADFCGDGDDHFLAVRGSGGGATATEEECLHTDALLPPRCCADAVRHHLVAVEGPAATGGVTPASDAPSSAAVAAAGVSTMATSVAAAAAPSSCTAKYQNCYPSGCCADAPTYRCFQKYAHRPWAQCRPTCPTDGTWACDEVAPKVHPTNAVPPPPAPRVVLTASPPPPHARLAPWPTSSAATTGMVGDVDAHFGARNPEWAAQGDDEPHGFEHGAGGRFSPADDTGRLLLLAAGVVAFVSISAGSIVCLARAARRRETARERAQGISMDSARFKVDLRARSSSASRQRTAYIQMSAPVDELEPVDILE